MPARRPKVEFWTAPKDIWRGPCFVIAGGTSVREQPIERLRGRQVIVINSSYERAPWAPYLVFFDSRWFRHHRAMLEKCFRGEMVTITTRVEHPRLRHMIKEDGPGLDKRPTRLTARRTSTTLALNLAYHLGGNPCIVLGADMCADERGKTHHHHPHPRGWTTRPKTWERHMEELKQLGPSANAAGFRILNGSPISKIDFWKRTNLDDWL